ncbi:MAG TPA: AbrB/MazE/SpoVT family DNA-binding domain-containing protein [Gemmatimonadaceae bacterium]|jgi:antitoxin MazE|nr:AbrB/MazE/SpoVT family DNA-binding domain-containing protein [Gemmatimonadaceae bacterium]
MITTVQRWGNSLAIRIPKPFAVETDLKENSEVDIALDGDRIVVRPTRKEWRLSDLVKAISPQNLHRETSWGDSAGREVW